MATMIAAYDSNGCVGRCDAKCYNATCENCTCVCGGMNHGAGLQRAVQNTTEMAESWIEAYDQKMGESLNYKVLPTPVQLNMFEMLGVA